MKGQHITHQYFKVPAEHEKYHGKRFFRVTITSYEVLQCVLSPGSESRRGRGNAMGIYLISSPTFYSNYMPYGYAIPCSEKEFFGAVSASLGVLFPEFGAVAQSVKKKKK